MIIGELDEKAALERDRRLGAELAAGTATTVRQAFIPDLAAGLLYRVADGTLRTGAGQLFPQPWVQGASIGRTRLDDLVRGGFYVVCVDSQAAEQARACVSRVAHLAASKVICIGGTSGCTDGSDVPGIVYCEEDCDTVQRWLAERSALAAVVRPDGFVYGGARTEHELADVIASLGNALIDGASAPPKSTVASGGLGHAEDRTSSRLAV
ncbi:hypothetical protein WN982_25235 [Paraburkholderia sp. IMGN_8]|uniref:hypothetical protein n=1 Tax=Paraburkholderia sp. IMGN_8 TaxID=3136564 RepID=UPI0031011C7A